MGGMAAQVHLFNNFLLLFLRFTIVLYNVKQIPIRGDPAANEAALAKVKT
jgi:hypothetical protein